MQPKLIVLCGLQCSGKSTWADKKIMEDKSYIRLSSDDYRLLHPNWNNTTVFKHLYKDLNNALTNGINVILDATNTTIETRALVLNNLKVDCYKTIYFFNTPFEECLTRLKNRNASNYPHKIPVKVLKSYYQNFQMPTLDEGWDKIETIGIANQKSKIYN